MNKNYHKKDKHHVPKPWEGKLKEEEKEGATVKGRVVEVRDFGAVLEIRPGVEGLILIHEVSWSNEPINARNYFKLDQEHLAKITLLRRKDKRMFLSIKQLTPDPWNKIEEKYPIKSRHTGLVKQQNPYGVFVELEYGIGGMLPFSSLSMEKNYDRLIEIFHKDLSIEVSIVDIDIDQRKILLKSLSPVGTI